MSANVRQRPLTSINVCQRPSMFLNVHQRPSTSVNVRQHPSTSATSVNIRQRALRRRPDHQTTRPPTFPNSRHAAFTRAAHCRSDKNAPGLCAGGGGEWRNKGAPPAAAHPDAAIAPRRERHGGQSGARHAPPLMIRRQPVRCRQLTVNSDRSELARSLLGSELLWCRHGVWEPWEGRGRRERWFLSGGGAPRAATGARATPGAPRRPAVTRDGAPTDTEPEQLSRAGYYREL